MFFPARYAMKPIGLPLRKASLAVPSLGRLRQEPRMLVLAEARMDSRFRAIGAPKVRAGMLG